MKYLYQFALLDDVKKQTERTFKYTDRIQEAMNQTAIATDFVSWTFARKDKQNEALKAIEFLNSDLAAQFQADASLLEQTASSSSRISESDAWEAYEKSANPLLSLIE